MLTNPDSLMAKVFKSIYFKNSDPLNASLGSRPSYEWRSIFAAQKLIKQGATVIIGNGRRTKVWQHRWIGRETASMVQSMKLTESQNCWPVSYDMTVSELIDQSGKAWKENLLEDLFTQEVQEKIRKITPAGRRSEDTYAWKYTKTGHYTVKSGYWVQMNIVGEESEQEEVTQPSIDGLYQQAWSVEAIPKV